MPITTVNASAAQVYGRVDERDSDWAMISSSDSHHPASNRTSKISHNGPRVTRRRLGIGTAAAGALASALEAGKLRSRQADADVKGQYKEFEGA